MFSLVRVLVVEDSPEDRYIIRRHLGRLGVAEVVEADSVGRALAIVREERIDCLVVDLDLPDSHGLDGLDRLVGALGRDRIAVVVLTGSGDSGLAVRTLDAGAHDFLVKGELTEAELWRAMLNAMEKARLGRELAAQREWSQSTLASIADAVIATDLDACVTFLNPEAERFTGWTEADARGRPVAEVVHLAHEGLDEIASLAGAGELDSGPIPTLHGPPLSIVSRDGREVPVDVRLAPIRDRARRRIGTVLVLRDVTQRKQAEEERTALLERESAAREAAEAATRAKDDFLAALSHELRTPLNAILGWTAILRRSPAGADIVGRAVETIERNVRMQSQLVEDILDVSRIISGKLRLKVSVVDLRTVVTLAVDTVQQAAETKGISLHVDAETAETVDGDPDRLQQVVWNLLSNAIKFTPSGGSVSLAVVREGDDAVITVGDTGPGIDPELLPHVFDRYWQAEGGTTRRHGGLGLGLAIVRHIVALHGGEVTAANAATGTGAVFTFRLRARRGAAATPVAVETKALDDSVAAKALGGVRVLVVDDEPDTLAAVQYILAAAGAEVAVASTAGEAVRAVETRVPDVLVSDIGLPEEDGYSLIRRIRHLPAAVGGSIPAVAVTAYAGSEDRLRALAAGFQMHVTKPVEPSELVAVVGNLAGLTLKGAVLSDPRPAPPDRNDVV